MKKTIAYIIISILFIGINGTYFSAGDFTDTIDNLKKQEALEEKSNYSTERILIKMIDSQTDSDEKFSLYGENKTKNTDELEMLEDSFCIYGIKDLEPIITSENPLKNNSSIENPVFSSKSLIMESATWYIAYINSGKDVLTIIDDIKKDSRILYAEPDYIHYGQVSEIPDITTDPGMEEQWHLDAINMKEAWSYLEEENIHPGGSEDIIVAVIDSGVDYNHPELKDRLWVNPNETKNGLDDDNNGYIDDIIGVNIDTGKSEPMDTNGHGTHVAGIIAATANNDTGGVGVAFNIKIMAINASMPEEPSDEYEPPGFHTSSIVKAIYYAAENGADVINISIGGTDASLLYKEALRTAYKTTLIVASAGNSKKHNQPGIKINWNVREYYLQDNQLNNDGDYTYEDWVNYWVGWNGFPWNQLDVERMKQDFWSEFYRDFDFDAPDIDWMEIVELWDEGDGRLTFPAVHPFVIGVMAEAQTPTETHGYLTTWSNWDLIPNNEYEYEIMAPGTKIYSTVRGGGYEKWGGTSMSSPIVAGVAALLRSKYPDKSIYTNDMLFKHIISVSGKKQGIFLDTTPSFHSSVDAYKILSIPIEIEDEPVIPDDPIIDNPIVVLYGDINGDGVISNIDLIFLLRYIAGIEVDNFDVQAADINQNGIINNQDLIILRRYLAGLTTI